MMATMLAQIFAVRMVDGRSDDNSYGGNRFHRGHSPPSGLDGSEHNGSGTSDP